MKHTNNGDIRFTIFDTFIQSLESPSVRDLFGSHIGENISIPISKIKKSDYTGQIYGSFDVRGQVL